MKQKHVLFRAISEKTSQHAANKWERATTVKACTIGNKVTHFVITMKFKPK